jgi:predicted Rossmann fold nucleotide-binding protein DprA/Smf involved in DNA uptake
MTTITPQQRREWAYWLTLAFRLEGEPRRALNGLVLTADRKLQLGLVDLVRMDRSARPREIERYASTLDRLLEAEGKVTAQAFAIDRILSLGCRVVPITARTYPPHLAHRIGPASAPTVLTIAGNDELWRSAGVAISGSRKAGPSGLAFARAAARAVAQAGQIVVCGLAAGVDHEALEGALEAGGNVLGIAPEGLLHSRWLRRPEIEQGRLAVVSEFAPDDRWTAGRATARNRTIAGFSSALVIADCVASGGTTDQLEVHRAAGLEVYVRTGAGQGAFVDEVCSRPGVTRWPWSDGGATWPPPKVTAAT